MEQKRKRTERQEGGAFEITEVTKTSWTVHLRNEMKEEYGHVRGTSVVLSETLYVETST